MPRRTAKNVPAVVPKVGANARNQDLELAKLRIENANLKKEVEELKKHNSCVSNNLAYAVQEKELAKRKIEEVTKRNTVLEKELAEARSRMQQMVARNDEMVKNCTTTYNLSQLLTTNLEVMSAASREAKRVAEAEVERAEWFKNRAKELMKQLKEGQVPCDHMDVTPAAATSMPLCQICQFEFGEHPDRVPRTLGCGHSVCHSCAQNLWRDGVIKCPFDRRPFVLHMGRVSALPKNFTVLEMIEEKERKQDETNK